MRPISSFLQHLFYLSDRCLFEHARYMSTSCQGTRRTGVPREWWRKTASREHGSDSSRLDGSTTHTWLPVARRACLMEHCSRRRSVSFLSSSTKRRIEAEHGRVFSLTEGRSSLTYPWHWPAFHWVDKLIYFFPDISPFRRAIDLGQGPSPLSICLSFCTFVFPGTRVSTPSTWYIKDPIGS